MKRTYQSLLVRQRNNKYAPVFCLFVAPAGELLEWAVIERLAEKEGAPQRIEKPAKTRAIASFIGRDKRNTLPNSVLVTIDFPRAMARKLLKEAKYGKPKVVNLAIDSKKTQGLIIDGQHRLLGARKYDPQMPLCVVGLIGANDLETAFQFLVVNHKAARVPSDHIRALTLEYSDTDLADRLKTARFALSRQAGMLEAVDDDQESPFFNGLQWPRNRTGNGLVLPAAIETALAYICSKSPSLESEEDLLLEFFFAIWRVTKAAWPTLWVADSRLLSKVGVVTASQYFAELLINLADAGELNIADPTAVEERMHKLIEAQAPEFWTLPWTEQSLDTAAGRKIVVESLKAIARNKRAGRDWFEDVQLVGPVAGVSQDQ